MATHIICLIAISVFVSATHAKYIGCFQDNLIRILDGEMTSGSMTVEKCVQRCSMENALYAGVEAGEQSFCGSEFRPYAKQDETECAYDCQGNPAQKCGGIWKISVYETRN